MWRGPEAGPRELLGGRGAPGWIPYLARSFSGATMRSASLRVRPAGYTMAAAVANAPFFQPRSRSPFSGRPARNKTISMRKRALKGGRFTGNRPPRSLVEGGSSGTCVFEALLHVGQDEDRRGVSQEFWVSQEVPGACGVGVTDAHQRELPKPLGTVKLGLLRWSEVREAKGMVKRSQRGWTAIILRQGT